jgi:hypothetical protein
MIWKLISILTLSTVAALFVHVCPDGLWDDDAGGQAQSEQSKSDVFVIGQRAPFPSVDDRKAILTLYPRSGNSLSSRTKSVGGFAICPTFATISTCILLC